MAFPMNPFDDDFVRQAATAFSTKNIRDGAPDKVMTQLRKVFNEVVTMDESARRESGDGELELRLHMMAPRIQYYCARAGAALDQVWGIGSENFQFSTRVSDWFRELAEMHDNERRKKGLRHVRLALEAMVAYVTVAKERGNGRNHSAHGGR